MSDGGGPALVAGGGLMGVANVEGCGTVSKLAWVLLLGGL